MTISVELFREILEVYDLGSRHGWHNRCLSDAIRTRIDRFGHDPHLLDRHLKILLTKRRAAASVDKDEYARLHPEKVIT